MFIILNNLNPLSDFRLNKSTSKVTAFPVFKAPDMSSLLRKLVSYLRNSWSSHPLIESQAVGAEASQPFSLSPYSNKPLKWLPADHYRHNLLNLPTEIRCRIYTLLFDYRKATLIRDSNGVD